MTKRHEPKVILGDIEDNLDNLEGILEQMYEIRRMLQHPNSTRFNDYVWAEDSMTQLMNSLK
jgi:hypothetical protein